MCGGADGGISWITTGAMQPFCGPRSAAMPASPGEAPGWQRCGGSAGGMYRREAPRGTVRARSAVFRSLLRRPADDFRRRHDRHPRSRVCGVREPRAARATGPGDQDRRVAARHPSGVGMAAARSGRGIDHPARARRRVARAAAQTRGVRRRHAILRPHRRARGALGGRGPRGARPRAGRPAGVLVAAAAGASRHAQPRDGVLLPQPGRDRGARGAPPGRGARGGVGFRRPPRQRHRGDPRRCRGHALRVRAPDAVLPGHRAGRGGQLSQLSGGAAVAAGGAA